VRARSDREWTKILSEAKPETEWDGSFVTTHVYIGDGINLKISASKDKKSYSKSWVLRYALHGRKRQCGLGRFPDVGIAEMRVKAESVRAPDSRWQRPDR
jgi:hypothetical protein